jgi:hypothetical protein
MIMLKNSFLDFQSSNDRIFSRPWMIHDIRFDMILLENQLPFFFLNDLLKLSNPCKGYSLIEFTHRFLKGALGSWVTNDIKWYQFLTIMPKDIQLARRIRGERA